MKRLIVLVLLLALLSGFVLSDIADTSASVSDSGIPDNEVTSNASNRNSSSASATITITITPVSLGNE